jgi:hypothetical protein
MFVLPPSVNLAGSLGYSRLQDVGERRWGGALDELVGQSPAALHAVLDSNFPGVKLLDRGIEFKDAIEVEFQKNKQGGTHGSHES